VLDTLLEDGRLDFEGISGTSAGAMNAVALAHGFAQAEGKSRKGARDSARQSLADFWEGVVNMGALSSTLAGAHKVPFDLLFGGLSALTGSASPEPNALGRGDQLLDAGRIALSKQPAGHQPRCAPSWSDKWTLSA